MSHYQDKTVLVIGLGVSGRAAAELLLRQQAKVVAVDSGDSPGLRESADALRALGAVVKLGVGGVPEGTFDLGVISPGVPLEQPWIQSLIATGLPLIGEMELGYSESKCLSVAITGTDGKTTTTRLVEHMLRAAGRRTIAAGNIGLPLCAVADQTRELDVLVVEASSFQLQSIRFFRPIIAVLTNLAPDHLDRHGTMEAYARAKGRIFENQQPFDWAIVQLEALRQLEAAGVKVPSKCITFSASDPSADLHLDRTLLVSRLTGWEGPLLDMEKCRLKGPHNAENLMAALAVGKTLRLPLEATVQAVQAFESLAHRCEPVREVGGVTYINDSKSTSLHSLMAAIRAVPPASEGRPNIWLIAGGKSKGLDYHDAGPVLAQRVKGALLIGETRERLRAAWSLFTPCSLTGSLLEAVREAARRAVPGDVVLLSPACSSFDQFQNYQHRGDVFRQAVMELADVSNP